MIHPDKCKRLLNVVVSNPVTDPSGQLLSSRVILDYSRSVLEFHPILLVRV